MNTNLLEKRNVCVVTLTKNGIEVNVGKWSYASTLSHIKEFYENELDEHVKYIFEPDKVSVDF